jgi:hypothetical protein
MVVRVFADVYSAEVAGLLLIDPTNEEAVIAAGDPALPILERSVQGLLAELGIARLIGRSLVSDAVGGRPPPEVLDAVPVLYGADGQAATVAELDASVESARRVQQTVRPVPGATCRWWSSQPLTAPRPIAPTTRHWSP